MSVSVTKFADVLEYSKSLNSLTFVDELRECGCLLPPDVANLLADAVVDSDGVSVVRILRLPDEGDPLAF